MFQLRIGSATWCYAALVGAVFTAAVAAYTDLSAPKLSVALGGAQANAIELAGPSASVMVTVVEHGYQGLFHAASVDGRVVAVSSSAAMIDARRRAPVPAGSAFFIVNATGRGRAAIAISDDLGHTKVVPVSVGPTAMSPRAL
jgi:hypothetical protein